jgi:hypothetical protein
MNQQNYKAALEHFQKNRYCRAAQKIDVDEDMDLRAELERLGELLGNHSDVIGGKLGQVISNYGDRLIDELARKASDKGNKTEEVDNQ